MSVKPWNVLLVFTDEQLWSAVGAYGNPLVRTPHIDALAEQGALFRNAVCSQPVCTPSRASLLTGNYPHTHGDIKNNNILTTNIPTLAELLRPRDYRCGYIGKWHLGNEVHPQRGFEEYWRSTEDCYTSPAERAGGHFSSYHHFLMANGFCPANSNGKKFPEVYFTREEACAMPERFGKPSFTAEQAEEFFRTQAGRPFFLAINFLEPHPPYTSPYDDLYPPDMPLPETYHGNRIEEWPKRLRAFHRFYYEKGHNGVATKDPAAVRRLIGRYYGMCSLVDKYVGRILDAMRKHGFGDNTIVLFTSDHGDMLGAHQLIEKCVMFEEALRVPLIVRHPRLTARPIQTPALTCNVDVVPTVLEMLGVDIPSHVQGKSLLPLFKGGKSVQEAVFSEWMGVLQNMHARQPEFAEVLDCQIRTVRTDRWKLNVNAGDRWELYDLENDPREMRNLAAEPSLKATIDELSGYLGEWQRQTGDKLKVCR